MGVFKRTALDFVGSGEEGFMEGKCWWHWVQGCSGSRGGSGRGGGANLGAGTANEGGGARINIRGVRVRTIGIRETKGGRNIPGVRGGGRVRGRKMMRNRRWRRKWIDGGGGAG